MRGDVYGVIDSRAEEAIELFIRRDDAETFVRDVRQDEPELADELRIEAIKLGAGQGAT